MAKVCKSLLVKLRCWQLILHNDLITILCKVCRFCHQAFYTLIFSNTLVSYTMLGSIDRCSLAEFCLEIDQAIATIFHHFCFIDHTFLYSSMHTYAYVWQLPNHCTGLQVSYSFMAQGFLFSTLFYIFLSHFECAFSSSGLYRLCWSLEWPFFHATYDSFFLLNFLFVHRCRETWEGESRKPSIKPHLQCNV